MSFHQKKYTVNGNDKKGKKLNFNKQKIECLNKRIITNIFFFVFLSSLSYYLLKIIPGCILIITLLLSMVHKIQTFWFLQELETGNITPSQSYCLKHLLKNNHIFQIKPEFSPLKCLYYINNS